MISIIALGNPGDMYVNTRHNVGWKVMEFIIKKNGIHEPIPSSFSAHITDGVLHGENVEVLFPMTYMNKSGNSVKQYLNAQETHGVYVIVHDDIDIPFGTIRVSYNRGAGGHNGVRSIIQSCEGIDFVRIRIGIAHVSIFGRIKRPSGDGLSKYVLHTFTSKEMDKMDEICEKVDKTLKLLINEGIEKAMQEVNM